MPSKAVCCGEKAVVVSIYVEKPRGSLKPGHRHQSRQRPVHNGRADWGPNRRANLLRYCQNLREMESVESAALIPKHRSSAVTTTSRLSSDLSSTLHRPPLTDEQHDPKIILAGAERKHSKAPTCFGDWRELIPRFMNSLMGINRRKENRKMRGQNVSASCRMRTVIKSSNVQRKLGFVKKLLKALRKRS